MQIERKHYIIGILIGVAYFIFLASQLSQYGMTWDESLYFSSGLSYVNYFQGSPLTVGNISNSANYGPFVDILSTYTYMFFGKITNLMDPIAAHRLPIAFLAALAVCAVYFFVLRNHNMWTAILSAIFTGFFPRFFAHAHFNAKDIPIAGLFVVCLFVFYEATFKKKWWLSISAGILLGISFAVKFNAVFIPVILLIWWIVLFEANFKKIFYFFKNRIDLLVAFIIAVPSSIAVWPWLWHDTINGIRGIFHHFLTVGKGFSVFYYGKAYVSGTNVPWHYPYGYLLVVTPLLILVLAGIGIFFAAKNIRSHKSESPDMHPTIYTFYSLILIWFVIVTIKVSISGMVYDGIRQFFEAVPAIGILAGFGFWIIIKTIHSFYKKMQLPSLTIIVLVCVLLLYLPTIITLTKLHPYESSYFNELVGGTQGAVGKFRISYWGEPIKYGIEWLNQNAATGSSINVIEAPHIAKYYIRKDLRLVQGNGGDYIVTLNAFPVRPIYTISVDSVPILNIYKGNTAPNLTAYPDEDDLELFYKQEFVNLKESKNE
ncbi:TPA: hypothetical protein HA363_06410 [Candidatus Woesearchaeota archaeon]|nr:hypothetical protein [Candidatus Woesearchaeota archaeon]